MKNLQAKNILKIHFICREVLISVPTLETTQDYSIQLNSVLPVMNWYTVWILYRALCQDHLQRVFRKDEKAAFMSQPLFSLYFNSSSLHFTNYSIVLFHFRSCDDNIRCLPGSFTNYARFSAF